MDASGRSRLGLMMAILLVAVMVAVSYQASRGQVAAGYPYRANMLEAGASVAGALFVIALFIERFMATVNALVFGEKQREAELALLAGEDQPVALRQLSDVLGKKERLRLLLGFVAGVFASAAGARTLEGLLDLSKGSMQNPLVLPVDVLLTAGLLAGGSNGLAYLVEVLKERITSGAGGAGLLGLRSRLVTAS